MASNDPACVSDQKRKKNDNDDISILNSMVSIEKVIEAVEALPEMEEDVILDAFDFLIENENKAKVFISMDVKFRRKWLIRQLRPQPQMQIFVKTLDGRKMNLDVLTSDTISDVKAKIERKEGYPKQEQRLVFNGWKLHDDRTLASCGLWSGSSLHLILCVCD